jgi:hypothetical protein
MSAVNTGKLAVIGGIAIIAGVSFVDRSVNYVPAKARITSAKVDCYVEGKKGRVVHKDTNDTAYMACNLAPALKTTMCTRGRWSASHTSRPSTARSSLVSTRT